MRKKHSSVASCTPPDGDWACNPGLTGCFQYNISVAVGISQNENEGLAFAFYGNLQVTLLFLKIENMNSRNWCASTRDYEGYPNGQIKMMKCFFLYIAEIYKK